MVTHAPRDVEVQISKRTTSYSNQINNTISQSVTSAFATIIQSIPFNAKYELFNHVYEQPFIVNSFIRQYIEQSVDSKYRIKRIEDITFSLNWESTPVSSELSVTYLHYDHIEPSTVILIIS